MRKRGGGAPCRETPQCGRPGLQMKCVHGSHLFELVPDGGSKLVAQPVGARWQLEAMKQLLPGPRGVGLPRAAWPQREHCWEWQGRESGGRDPRPCGLAQLFLLSSQVGGGEAIVRCVPHLCPLLPQGPQKRLPPQPGEEWGGEALEITRSPCPGRAGPWLGERGSHLDVQGRASLIVCLASVPWAV